MNVSMAGCTLEFVSGVKALGNGVFQLDGTPVQLRLTRSTKTGGVSRWLSALLMAPTEK